MVTITSYKILLEGTFTYHGKVQTFEKVVGRMLSVYWEYIIKIVIKPFNVGRFAG